MKTNKPHKLRWSPSACLKTVEGFRVHQSLSVRHSTVTLGTLHFGPQCLCVEPTSVVGFLWDGFPRIYLDENCPHWLVYNYSRVASFWWRLPISKIRGLGCVTSGGLAALLWFLSSDFTRLRSNSILLSARGGLGITSPQRLFLSFANEGTSVSGGGDGDLDKWAPAQGHLHIRDCSCLLEYLYLANKRSS